MPLLPFGSPPIQSTAVTPGSYTNANVTFNKYGQATAASNGSGGGTTVTNNYNTLKIDQTGGAGTPTYGVLAGAVNGTNKVFTVSNGSYVSGSLMVFLNGEDLTQGTDDWQETTPGSGTFSFTTAPPTASIIQVVYVTTTSTSGNVAQPISTKTSAYTISATTDNYIRADGTSGAYNVTAPTASTCTGFEFIVKKIDSSANAITVVGTFDGATNYSLATQYKYVRFRSNGTTYDVVGSN